MNPPEIIIAATYCENVVVWCKTCAKEVEQAEDYSLTEVMTVIQNHQREHAPRSD